MIPQSDLPVSIFPDASGHYWTVSGQDKVTAAHVERNGVWQTMKCVSAVTSKQCHISLLPARWLNSTVVYNIYTLQTKLLLIGWRRMVHRIIQNITLHMDYRGETIKWHTRATYGCMATGQSPWPWAWLQPRMYAPGLWWQSRWSSICGNCGSYINEPYLSLHPRLANVRNFWSLYIGWGKLLCVVSYTTLNTGSQNNTSK